MENALQSADTRNQLVTQTRNVKTPNGASAATLDLERIVNVASVPQRSPFRYPGGKTWLVPHIRHWLRSKSERPALLVEPFAGGGIIGLTAAFEALTERVLLVELDEDVAAVWRTMLNGHAAELAERISQFEMTLDNARQTLSTRPRNLIDRAFAALLRNRVQHGGIMADGASLMKQGEAGRGIASRWYPETLAERVLDIASMRGRIDFRRGDGFAVIESLANDPRCVFFVDPPYTVAGRRLYRHAEIDHERLFRTMARVAGDFVLTYDDTPEVRAWTHHSGFECETIAMKTRQNGKKTELLIGRSLAWARTPRRETN